jgi:hypothetical protein
MSFYKGLLHNSRKELTFMLTPKYILHIKENVDQTFVPRFSLKNIDIFDDFPTNTPTKFTPELILKAINWGMIIQIDYKGDEDDNFSGHERVIYPVAFGKSKDGKYLIRGYHLKGWSISRGGNVQKEWRLFRADRILNMTFSGAFFRLAPDGYNADGDKGITKLMARADFNQIRNNQQSLLNKNDIDTLDRVILNKITEVEVKDLNYNFKIFSPWSNNIIPKKDAKNIRITFAKPLIGNGQWIAIVGSSIEPNNIFKLKLNNTIISSYKSVKWIMADELDKTKNIESQVEFKLYLFLKAK